MAEKKKTKKPVEECSMSVANEIKAWALINIEDIFRFTLTATDEQIEERYATEYRAMEVAEKYLDIALRVDLLQHPIQGWSIAYDRPVMDSDERKDYLARFYDVKGDADGRAD